MTLHTSPIMLYSIAFFTKIDMHLIVFCGFEMTIYKPMGACVEAAPTQQIDQSSLFRYVPPYVSVGLKKLA